MTFIVGTFIAVALFWIYNRKVDKDYTAALKARAKGVPKQEERVNEFLNSKRPTCIQARQLLRTITFERNL